MESNQHAMKAILILVPFGFDRTALLLMNRADSDRGGEADRDALFAGVNKLKDNDSSVVNQLFELVELFEPCRPCKRVWWCFFSPVYVFFAKNRVDLIYLAKEYGVVFLNLV